VGFLAWDKRTGEVIYSLPTPHGYVGRFNWEYVFQDNPDYPEHIGTMDNGPELTTEEGVSRRRGGDPSRTGANLSGTACFPQARG
jgi:hypothetical protein